MAGAAGDPGENNDVVGGQNEAENNNAEVTEARAENVQAPVQPPQLHPLNVLSTFVTTFFTSLLPNDPQVA